MGWRSKGLVEPSHQIVMREESHAQERHQIRQTPAEAESELQIA